MKKPSGFTQVEDTGKLLQWHFEGTEHKSEQTMKKKQMHSDNRRKMEDHMFLGQPFRATSDASAESMNTKPFWRSLPFQAGSEITKEEVVIIGQYLKVDAWGDGAYKCAEVDYRICELKSRHAIPDLACKKEAWELLVRSSEIIRAFPTMFMNGAHVQSFIPGLWQYAVGALLGKNSGTEERGAVHVIMSLEPVRILFFSSLWSRAEDVCFDNSDGFLRREDMSRPSSSKRRTIGLGQCCVYHDVNHAFPSPSHDVLKNTMQCVGHESDVQMLQHRYSNSRLRVDTGAQGSPLVHPGSGAMQGDVSMAQIFRTMSDEGLQHVAPFGRVGRSEECGPQQNDLRGGLHQDDGVYEFAQLNGRWTGAT